MIVRQRKRDWIRSSVATLGAGTASGIWCSQHKIGDHLALHAHPMSIIAMHDETGPHPMPSPNDTFSHHLGSQPQVSCRTILGHPPGSHHHQQSHKDPHDCPGILGNVPGCRRHQGSKQSLLEITISTAFASEAGHTSQMQSGHHQSGLWPKSLWACVYDCHHPNQHVSGHTSNKFHGCERLNWMQNVGCSSHISQNSHDSALVWPSRRARSFAEDTKN